VHADLVFFSAPSRQVLNTPGRGKFSKTFPQQVVHHLLDGRICFFKLKMPRDSDKLDGSLRSFSQGLFRDPVSVKIRDAAVQTKFFRDMVDGTLDPAIYGGYMVQDAAYCFNAVEAFDYAAQQMQEQEEPGFSLLYRVMSENFKGYNQDFLKHWKLKSSESVVMGPAAESYVGFESAISRKDARFLCIAMLPCTMLWPWIAGKLIHSLLTRRTRITAGLKKTSLNRAIKATWKSLLTTSSNQKKKRSHFAFSSKG